MIVVIGVVGFIGSCFVVGFNEMGCIDIVLCDDFFWVNKVCNWESK